MTKNLQKVQKQISKKRGALDALHANSRDSKRLRRASAREIKLARVAAEHVMGRQIYLDRVSFFKSYITEITIPLSDNDMSQLIDKLALLPTLLLERRRGRPPSRREGVLSQQEIVEAREFSTGFWLPDLGSVDNLRKLKAWNGDWSAMSNLDFLRLRTDGSKQRSMFPPN
ncbi:translation machinery-associated protein 16 [Ophidiomyces ophidiicola]|nr:translation machinery-associated protein 16 [Ophidiomyces ophidiicola]